MQIKLGLTTIIIINDTDTKGPKKAVKLMRPGMIRDYSMPRLLLSAGLSFILYAQNGISAKDIRSVGGWGEWSYEYVPSYLPMSEVMMASVEHAHGISIDPLYKSVVVTYKDLFDDSKCLLRWNQTTNGSTPTYDSDPEFLGPGKTLCEGVPHGLRAAFDERKAENVLYHANNQQVLHKTTMDGKIIWTVSGSPNAVRGAADDEKYRPTWLAAQPGSPFLYLADGYGSSKIYVLDSASGSFLDQSFGGIGTDHGNFQTCHSITWDERVGQMAVCDRENHRLEYFNIDISDPSVFSYSHTVSFYPLLQRPCNIRIRDTDGIAIVPALEGTVGILDGDNKLISLVNITAALGDLGFLHPHDAHFVPGTDGDFVLATWNPGRIGYFRRRHYRNNEVQTY